MPTLLAVIALIALAIGGFAAYRSFTHKESIVEDAAKCGNFHFPSPPTVVLAKSDADWHGDGRIELVADIPTKDLGGFEKLSALPPLTPGPPEAWREATLKEKELADVLRAGKPEDFQYVWQDASGSAHARGVTVQRLDGGKTRVYIGITCF